MFKRGAGTMLLVRLTCGLDGGDGVAIDVVSTFTFTALLLRAGLALDFERLVPVTDTFFAFVCSSSNDGGAALRFEEVVVFLRRGIVPDSQSAPSQTQLKK